MIACGMAPHVVHVVAPRVGYAGGTSRMEPTREETSEAEGRALAFLRSDFPDLAPDHADLVSKALDLASRKWDGEHSFAGLVRLNAKRLALSLLRTASRRSKAEAEMRVVADVRANWEGVRDDGGPLLPTPPDIRLGPSRPETIEALRDMTIHECRLRVLRGTHSSPLAVAWLQMPKDALVYFERKAERRRAARAALDLLEREPALVEVLDLATIKKWAHPATSISTLRSSSWVSLAYTVIVLRNASGEIVGEGLQHYAETVAAHGPVTAAPEVRTYGETDTEAATMSILSGSWPAAAKVGMTVAEAIEEEAGAIRKARRRTRTKKV